MDAPGSEHHYVSLVHSFLCMKLCVPRMLALLPACSHYSPTGSPSFLGVLVCVFRFKNRKSWANQVKATQLVADFHKLTVGYPLGR